jgi:hypothetical protein
LGTPDENAKPESVKKNASERGHLTDQWYYRLDARQHGPFTLAALQELIGSSGETAEQVVVRSAGGDDWMPFYAVPAKSTLAHLRGATSGRGAPEEQSTVSKARKSSAFAAKTPARACPERYGQFVMDNREIVSIVLWALLNVGVLVAWSDPYAAERQYFTTSRQLEDEARVLQSRNASAQEWIALRAKAKQALAPIVADLKRKASVARPIRQHLLWAARVCATFPPEEDRCERPESPTSCRCYNARPARSRGQTVG